MKRKILLFVAVLAVIGILTSVVLVVHNKNQEENTINKYCDEIDALLDSFNFAQEKDEKLSDYKELNALYDNYLNSDKSYNEVTSRYESALSSMQEYFQNYYIEELNNLTLDVSSEEDRNKLKEFISSLNDLSEELSKDSVLEDTSDIKKQIDDNIENYNNKIDEVTNNYYVAKIDEIKVSDEISTMKDKENLNSKIESLNNLSTELDSDEFIKEDKLNEFKETIQSEIDSYTNRVAEIDAEEKAEAERIAQQAVASNNNNNSSKPSSTPSSSASASTQTSAIHSSQPFTQTFEGVIYTAPANVTALRNQGHGIQLNVVEYGDEFGEWIDGEWIITEVTNQRVVPYWIDRTTGIWYLEDGSIYYQP